MKATTIIKSITVGAFALLCNFTYSSTTNFNPNNDSLCLKLNGKVSKTKESAGHTYTVQLIQNYKVITSQVIKAGKTFNFYLNKNAWYGVKINASGCVSKTISVNTTIPADQELEKFMVSFEIEEPISNREAEYLDQDAIDFPLSILSYHNEVENFEGNDEYSKNIKTILVAKELAVKGK